MAPIAEWLERIGLAQYAQSFAENDIDDSVLCDLTDRDLEKLGVSLGHRRKILRAIAAASAAGRAASPLAGGPAALGAAERRQLTVLFCDLVDSTALSARLDPEDLREIINAYHRCCADVISKSGGYVSRYVGDGVLAYFGYPLAHEDDPERAVRAALMLIEAVVKLHTSHIARLEVRIGIATGIAIVGDLIGEGEAHDHGVVGETPNLAARLQSVARASEVVISHNTQRLTRGLFDYGDLGLMSLKGLAQPVRAWRVLGASAVESRFEAQHGAGLTRLVGRDEEIELVLRRWQQAKRGEGCVVLLSGEPGIGKSRIAQALSERLGAETCTRLRLFCSPDHQNDALYPSMTQLQRAAGFRREDTVEERLDKLEAVLGRATDDVADAAPLLAELLALPTGDRYPPLKLSPQKRKQRTLDALIAQLEGLAARQPVLFAFEDAHWSDATSLELLDRVVERVPRLPVLLIITFRPEFTPHWIGRSHVSSLFLNRLAPRQRAEMIGLVTEGKELPREVTEQIIDRTDGVPLFIEELTKAILESGLLLDAGDRYTMTGPLPARAIPMTLNASLLARLDRLGPVREVAQIGAALGRHFSHDLIGAVVPMPARQLQDALTKLVEAELVFRRGNPPDAEYSFKHSLVQDAAYSTLLRSDRQRIHIRIAAALERQFPDIADSQPARLAQHCSEAGLTEKAIGYWLKAGQRAVARSAMTEAAAQLQKGLELCGHLADGSWRQQQELDLRVALGRALIATRGYSAPVVGETFARARALAEQLGRREYLVPLLHGQWAYHMVRSELSVALSRAEQMEEIGKAQGDRNVQLLSHYLNGMLRFYLGDFDAARARLEQCRELGEPARREAVATVAAADPYASAMAHLAETLICLGEVERGRSLLNDVLCETGRLGHAYTLAMVMAFACWTEWISGLPEQVNRRAEETAALSIEHNFPLWQAWGIAYSGWSHATLQHEQEGLAILAEGLKAVRATGTVLMTPYWLMLLADAHRKLGQPAAGLSCLDEAARILESAEERFEEAELHRLRGELLNGMGETAAAEQSLRQALVVARRQDAKTWELRAATSLARLWQQQGKAAEARALLAPVCGWFRTRGDTPDVAEAKRLMEALR